MSVVNINSTDYNQSVLEGKVIVKVSSPTCGPCKMMAPLFEKISEEFPEIAFKAFEVDTDEDQVLARSLKVSAVPSFIVYQDNEVVTQFAGAFPASVLKTKLGL